MSSILCSCISQLINEPTLSIKVAMYMDLPPGAAQQSNIHSPGCGFTRRATSIDALSINVI